MQIKKKDTIVTITITITFNDCIDAELGSSWTGTFSVNHFEISVWWVFSHFRLLSPITVDRAMANRIFSVNLVLCVTTMSSNCEWFINKLSYDIWCIQIHTTQVNIHKLFISLTNFWISSVTMNCPIKSKSDARDSNLNIF